MQLLVMKQCRRDQLCRVVGKGPVGLVCLDPPSPPPTLGREGETAAYWLCQMGLSSWVGYHGGQVGKQAVPHPGALHGAGLLGRRAERGGGQVLGTGCATCPARGSPTQSLGLKKRRGR